MKTIIKIDEYYTTTTLAKTLGGNTGSKLIIILETVEDWNKREDVPKIINALSKLTQEEIDILGLGSLFNGSNSKLSKKMSEIGLSIRLSTILKSADCIEYTVKDFFEKIKIIDTMKFRNFGKKFLNELEALAQEVGISWQ